ncbi:Flagellar assembly factor FliW [Caloramator mitchellensis]|uniref:Flagellar assembly factor FliW n=1 Tax=Caloramator mitchellensis TaxID=908809 RepID=A0A0R3JR87_CALMK|nr:flagellar assembly protein FliW [Caloramator mitchellensis]KRQ85987.1 Flagellar assembly factor FliW [Caloramator mitchellensis]
MMIDTKFFGEIEIDENKILTFEKGIPGLEEYKKYAVIDVENSKLLCLQSIEEKNIALLVIFPWDYVEDYEIELSDEEIQELELNTHEDVIVYNVITVRENKITANLLAPIVVNVKNNKAKQIILNDKKYSIRQEIKC